MTRAEEYRRLAEHVHSRALEEENESVRAGWERLARCYVQLAEQTERNDQPEDSSDPIIGILGGSRH